MRTIEGVEHVDAAELARLAGVTIQTVRQLASRGLLPASPGRGRGRGRKLWFRVDDAQAFLIGTAVAAAVPVFLEV